MNKNKIFFSIIFTCMLFLTDAVAQSQKKKTEKLQATTVTPATVPSDATNVASKPNIVILATGGTIAGKAGGSTQKGYTSGQVTINAMLDAVPDARKIANITGEQIANVGSQDMSFEIMLKLANRINELTKSGNTDGIVITHGTDTMEETAYFLNLVTKTDKPIVLVGSMRPSDALSADGPLNLYNAIAVAADPEAKKHGVLVVMNDQIHSAQTLVKTNTTAVQTFMSPMRGIIGSTNYGKNEFYRVPHKKFGPQSDFSIEGVKALPRVDIIYADADMSPDLIDASVQNGAKGIVIAGVGNGNMPQSALDACKRATDKGIVVVRSSRVATGDVARDVEVKDSEYGTIASYELNPQKSRVLLSLALLKKGSTSDIQKLFMEY